MLFRYSPNGPTCWQWVLTPMDDRFSAVVVPAASSVNPEAGEETTVTFPTPVLFISVGTKSVTSLGQSKDGLFGYKAPAGRLLTDDERAAVAATMHRDLSKLTAAQLGLDTLNPRRLKRVLHLALKAHFHRGQNLVTALVVLDAYLSQEAGQHAEVLVLNDPVDDDHDGTCVESPGGPPNDALVESEPGVIVLSDTADAVVQPSDLERTMFTRTEAIPLETI